LRRYVNAEKLKQLYSKGLTYRQIARELRVSSSAIAKYVRKLGLARRRQNLTELYGEKIMRMIREKGVITVSDVVVELKLSRPRVAELLKKLELEGKIKRFNLFRGRVGKKYGYREFFSRLNKKAKLLYYMDEGKLIEKLCEVVEIQDRFMAKSFTRLLKDNKVSEEGIALFYELKSRFRC